MLKIIIDLCRTSLAVAAPKENTKKVSTPEPKSTEGKKKLSFNEKREFEEIEKQLPVLEAEKEQLEQDMSSGTLSTEELLAKSNRISQLIELIDEKTMRWLELSELA